MGSLHPEDDDDILLRPPYDDDVYNPDDPDDDIALILLGEQTEPPKPHLYARLLGRFPYVVAILVIVKIVVMACVAFLTRDFPDFNDPIKGFETRGTEIFSASHTQKMLYQVTRPPHATLVSEPKFDFPNPVSGRHRKSAATSTRLTWSTSQLPTTHWPTTHLPTPNTTNSQVQGTTYFPTPIAIQSPTCDSRGLFGDYTLAFQSSQGKSLFTAKALRAMCKIEDKYVKPYMPEKLCRRKSLAHAVASLRQKNCLDLTQADITVVAKILKMAAHLCPNATLHSTECYEKVCSGPPDCPQEASFYVQEIFYRMADSKFKETCRVGKPFLQYGRMMLENTATNEYFINHLEGGVEIDGVKLVAVHLDENKKDKLFEYYLEYDIRFFGLAMLLVLLVMMFYLKSFTLMLATVLNVGFSAVMAYFLYFFVFRQAFFPFMNVLAVLVLIAIGADDVFIFYDAWTQAKDEIPDGKHEHWIQKSFTHAALSVTVTSLTTAGAFFSNMVSSITSIRCFGLFAGICMLTNLVMMLTWTPSIIVMVDKVTSCCLRKCTPCNDAAKKCGGKLGDFSGKIFQQFFPAIIEKGRILWVILFLAIGVGGFVVTFYKPGLHLPVSQEFQLFSDDHLMEKWDKDIKFKFEDIQDRERHKQDIYVTFTWGLECRDNGNWMDPDNRGHLVYDPYFDIWDEAAQLAVEKFVNNTKQQDFMADYVKFRPSVWDAILQEGKRICSNSVMASLSHGCCANLTFPFPKDYLKCIGLLMAVDPGLKRLFEENYALGQILFDRDSGNAKVLVMGLYTKFPLSVSYSEMNEYYWKLHKFVAHQRAYMPWPGMRTLCFSGQGWMFRFYDLQMAIAKGTLWSIVFSLAIAAGISLLTSLNLMLTIYAVITITLAIAATVGTIVLMGWELNILESITVSMSAGLSVDFTIHYSVAYRLSSAVDRKARVRESFHRVGFAVAVAALTTFLAGAAVMPSHVIVYLKLGIFLMLVMSYSWLYATIFFQSLCSLFGPRGDFCQVPSPLKLFEKCKARRGNHRNRSMIINDDHDGAVLGPLY